MTDRVAGDSTTFTDIPLSVDIAMVYATGHLGVVTPTELNARFPHNHYGHAYIDATGEMPSVGIRDWESGDKAGSLEKWVAEHNDHSGKKDAVVYSNVSTIPEVRRLTGRMVLGKDYYLFVATLDGVAHKGEGVIACQRDGTAQTGAHWDRSFVYDDRFFKATGVVSPPPKTRPNCRPFQRAIRTKVDDLWGHSTDRHAEGLIHAGMGKFPYGVSFAQRVVGTVPDGIWGPHSKTAFFQTVVQAQTALTEMGFNTHTCSGIWDVQTNWAYFEARKACHI